MRAGLAVCGIVGGLAAACLEVPPAELAVDAAGGTGNDDGGGGTGDPDGGGTGDAGSPLDPDLIAYYPFDVLDGTTPDLASGLDAACVGTCPALVPGVLGSALRFSGSERLSVDDVAALRPAEGTLAMWIRVDEGSRYAGVVNKALAGTKAKSYEIYVDDTNHPIFKSTSEELAVGPVIATEQFIHVAGTWDATTRRLFVGGSLAMTKSIAAPLSFDGSPLVIGSGVDFGSPVSPFIGAVDDLRLYGRALDGAEIAALASADP